MWGVRNGVDLRRVLSRIIDHGPFVGPDGLDLTRDWFGVQNTCVTPCTAPCTTSVGIEIMNGVV